MTISPSSRPGLVSPGVNSSRCVVFVTEFRDIGVMFMTGFIDLGVMLKRSIVHVCESPLRDPSLK